MSTMFWFNLAKYFYIFILEHKLFIEPHSFHRAPLSAHFLEQIMCYVFNLLQIAPAWGILNRRGVHYCFRSVSPFRTWCTIYTCNRYLHHSCLIFSHANIPFPSRPATIRLEWVLKRGCQHPSDKFEILWQVAQNSFSLYMLVLVKNLTNNCESQYTCLMCILSQ